jgi:hypothetical protein
MNFTPFFVGETVVCQTDFSELSNIWNLKYPNKGEECIVLNIKPHPIHNFWLINIKGYHQELCHINFASKLKFKAISYEKIVELESILISEN